MLAQMVGSSTGLIILSEKNMDEYYKAVNPLAVRARADKTGTVSFSCENMKPFEQTQVMYAVSEKNMGDSEVISFYYDNNGAMP